MNRFEQRPKTTLAVILLIVFILAVAATEWALAPDGKTVVRGNESLPRPGRHLVLREWLPSAVFEFGTPDSRRIGAPVPDEYLLETDGNGFIEPARLHDDPAHEIVFLGGSTTECLYVVPERRFPTLVARLLEEETGLKINGINAGRSGNNTMHSLLALLAKVLPLRPETVVVMHNINDLGTLGRPGGYWTDDSDLVLVRSERRDAEALLRAVRDNLIPNTYRAVRRALRALRHGLAADAHAGPATAAAPPDGSLERMGRDYESALRSAVAVIRAWGSRPVLMTQAQIGSQGTGAAGDYLGEGQLRAGGFTPSSFRTAHAYFNAIVHHVALSEEILLIDLAAAAWTAEDLYDGLHFTDQGSERAARLIAAALAP